MLKKCFCRPCRGTKRFPYRVSRPRPMSIADAQEIYDKLVAERKKLVKYVLRQYRVENEVLDEQFVSDSRTEVRRLDLEIHKTVSLFPEVQR